MNGKNVDSLHSNTPFLFYKVKKTEHLGRQGRALGQIQLSIINSDKTLINLIKTYSHLVQGKSWC